MSMILGMVLIGAGTVMIAKRYGLYMSSIVTMIALGILNVIQSMFIELVRAMK